MNPQRVRLDRLTRAAYIGAGLLGAGCRPSLGPLVPAALEPVAWDSAVAWTRGTLPAQPTAIRFRWRYEDEAVKYAGRASAHIAPPDSLRFDYVGPLGLGSGAAVVVGDDVVWARPAQGFRSLVPAVRMLWAALGAVRPPAADARVFGRTEQRGDSTARAWRFVEGADTLDYVLWERAGGRRLEAHWRRGGRSVARSETRYQSAHPASARVDFPEAPARFELTVVAVDTAAAFEPALWRPRR